MENYTKCPKCHAKEGGCEYCAHLGYVILSAGRYYGIKVDANDNPIRGDELPALENNAPQKPGMISKLLLPEGEPHDLIWYLREKAK